MKVLQVVKTSTGAVWAFQQARWLHNHGVHIITVLPDTIGNTADLYIQNQMEVITGDFSLPTKNPLTIFSKIRKIRECIVKNSPDIVHCHFVTNIVMMRLALRKSNTPRLFQVPGPLHLESLFFRKLDIMLSNKYDYWAGACKKTVSYYLKDGIDPNRVFLAYYGGYGGDRCDEYRPNTYTLHREYNLPKEEVLIGMVSYFYRPKKILLQKRGIKGHEDFIDAFSIVHKIHPNIVGVIIGDAWGNSRKYANKIKKYAKKKCGDSLIFTGFRKDMVDIYRELDIVVHPSHSENLGGAAESLAAGVPTISTNVGGFPDIVIDGVTGITVDPKCPQKLANAIKCILEDMGAGKKMAANGQDYVRKTLDINTTALNVLYAYERIISSSVAINNSDIR